MVDGFSSFLRSGRRRSPTVVKTFAEGDPYPSFRTGYLPLVPSSTRLSKDLGEGTREGCLLKHQTEHLSGLTYSNPISVLESNM